MADFAGHKIAANNNNTAGLTLITSISTPSGYKFPSPRIMGTYNVGTLEQRASGLLTVSGKPSLQWVFDVAETDEYYVYLQDTYCAGGFSGLVTIRTPTRQAGSYANYNAIMQLPKLSDVSWDEDAAWQTGLTVSFIKLVSL